MHALYFLWLWQLELQIEVRRYIQMQGVLEQSKLSQHAHEKNHYVCCKVGNILQIVPNYIHGKSHISLPAYPISQPSLDFSHIIKKEVSKLQLSPI
jgi:hypothetical protein